LIYYCTHTVKLLEWTCGLYSKIIQAQRWIDMCNILHIQHLGKTQGILRIIKWFIIWLTKLLGIMFKGKTLRTNLHKHSAKQMCNRNLEKNVKDWSRWASMGEKKTSQSKGARKMEMLIFIQNCIYKIYHLELIPKSK